MTNLTKQNQIRGSLLIAIEPLRDVYLFYRANDLNDRSPEIFCGRGGFNLLHLDHLINAAKASTDQEIILALQPLVNIANAYDNNELDNEARKHWGRHCEFTNQTAPEDIHLVVSKGGYGPLLSLKHALDARELLSSLK